MAKKAEIVFNKTSSAGNNTPTKSITIIGQGAIGLLWYSHFYLNSATSTAIKLLTSPTRKKKITSFSFERYDGTSQQILLNEISLQTLHASDTILICVKAYQVAEVIKTISPYLTEQTQIILCHNGLGTFEELPREFLIKHPILMLLTTHGCMRKGYIKHNSLDIVHTGLGCSDLGLLAGNITSNQQTKLTHIFNQAMPEVHWCNNIVEKQWLKLAINCVINPLTAIYDINNGEISAAKFTDTIDEILQEIVALARLNMITLDATALKQTVLLVAQKTANNSSSMRCDVQQKQRTEIDYINGYLDKLGKQQGMNTPINSALYQRVLRLLN